MPKKKFDKTVKESGRNRHRVRRDRQGEVTLIPNVVPVSSRPMQRRPYVEDETQIRIICAKCERAGRLMLIDGETEIWYCMEHYFSHQESKSKSQSKKPKG